MTLILMNNVTCRFQNNSQNKKSCLQLLNAQSFLFCAILIKNVINHRDYMKFAQINQWCVCYVCFARFPLSNGKRLKAGIGGNGSFKYIYILF